MSRFLDSVAARVAIVAVWPIVAAVAVACGRVAAAALPEAEGSAVTNAGFWLAVLAAAYVATWALQWRLGRSFLAEKARLLIWAVVAFVCSSRVVDLVGGSWDIANQLAGLAPPGDPARVSCLRWCIGYWLVAAGMAATCIAVSPRGGEGEP